MKKYIAPVGPAHINLHACSVAHHALNPKPVREPASLRQHKIVASSGGFLPCPYPSSSFQRAKREKRSAPPKGARRHKYALSVSRRLLWRNLCKQRQLPCHTLKKRRVFSPQIRQSSALSIPRQSAIAAAVNATFAGSFIFPLRFCGER